MRAPGIAGIVVQWGEQWYRQYPVLSQYWRHSTADWDAVKTGKSGISAFQG